MIVTLLVVPTLYGFLLVSIRGGSTILPPPTTTNGGLIYGQPH